jgi:hypothetical protein
MASSGYTTGATESGGPHPMGGASTSQPAADYWSLSKCKDAYTDYLGSKSEEIEEQKDARRYYHASQWTEDQIKVLKKRNQPPSVFNRVGRKIDGVVGLIERIKQDPKAYPRTPKHEEGAELATAVVRYVMDEQRFDEKRPEVARKGAIDGIAGVEINIAQGDQGDPEVELEIVEPDSFFYDPRSYRADFTDAMYMGVAKWLDIETAKGMFPDHAEDLAALNDSSEFTSSPDRERKWFSTTGTKRQVRVVDLWYRHKGEWCYAIFTGSTVLMEGPSYLKDQKKKTICKYVMYSSNIDQDGDRYGFFRNLKWAQDSLNSKESKLAHIMASKRLILSQGAVQDVEVARREWARPDGVVLVNGAVNEGAKADDVSFDFTGWDKLLTNAKAEIENFGPNPALIGQGIENKSGRAIQLLQQAGMADLGPYLSGFKGWVLRVYRAVFNAVQQHWQAERWIRVTDDDGLAQFIQINGLGVDPNTGQPAIVNALGSLDVDIILDEGPDAVNMQADAYDTLTILAGQGAQVPPAVLIELSPLPSSQKKRIQEMLEQQSQGPQAQIQQRGAMAEIADKEAAAELKQAQTAKTMVETQLAPQQMQADAMGNAMGGDMPLPVESHKVAAEAEDKLASAELKRAQTAKVMQETALMPHQMRMEAEDREADRQIAFHNAGEDRKVKAQQAKQKARAPA